MNDNFSFSSLTTPPPASPLSGESSLLERKIEILLQIQNRSNLILLLPGGCVKSNHQVFFDILYKKDFISLLC